MAETTDARNARDGRLCLGVIVGTHGVRGTVRVKAYTETPEDLGAYGPLSDEAGRESFRLTVHGLHKGTVLAGIEGVGDREAALALKGTKLYVARDALPEVAEPETFYHADLIGLAVVDEAGRDLGKVVAVADFGAGDVLDLVGPDGQEWMLPFTREAVPEVDLTGGRLVVAPPAESKEDLDADGRADGDSEA
jgi:16S rRNA processing protein RimM